MSAVTEQSPAAAPDEVPLRHNRDFRLLWTGAGFSMLGSRAGAAGYALLVLWHTGSGRAAGLVAFAALLPNLVVPAVRAAAHPASGNPESISA